MNISPFSVSLVTPSILGLSGLILCQIKCKILGSFQYRNNSISCINESCKRTSLNALFSEQDENEKEKKSLDN